MHTEIHTAQRGSAFITVLGFCVLLLLLIASVLKYSTSERRLNNREKLHFEARLAAEAISEYGIAQVKNILDSNRTFTDSTWTSTDQSLFIPTGTYAGTILVPPDSFWGSGAGSHIVPLTGPSSQVPLIHVGKIMDTTGGSGLYFIDPTIPDNQNDPLKGKRVFRYNLDILSRATATDTFNNSVVTNYMQQSFAIRAAPLFANAVYYNMDLELQPGPNMVITGSTHSNGRMFIRSASASPAYIQFAGPVTAVRGFWVDFTPMPFFQNYNQTGALQDNVVNNASSPAYIQILPAGATSFSSTGSTDGLRLTANTSGFSPNLSSGNWVESTWNLAPSGETWQQHIGDPSTTTHTETNASKENYANWIQQRFKGNLLTNVNGIAPVTLQGIPDYVYVYGSAYPDPKIGGVGDGTCTSATVDNVAYTYGISGANDTNNAAHALIEPPHSTGATAYYKPTEDIKYSRNAGLYIVANTDATTARYGHMPDGTLIKVAAQSYRAFMNDTSVSPAVITEVLLPGQNTYGDNNAQNNPYTSTSSVLGHVDARPVVTLFDINYTGTNPNWFMEKTGTARRKMYDLRRTSNYQPPQGTTSGILPNGRSSTNVYDPKLIYTIDVDMTELKKAVWAINNVTVGSSGTTPAVYYGTDIPTSSNFAKYIYNSSITATTTLNTATVGNTNQIVIAPPIANPTLALTKAFTATTWNGAVYVESITAELFDTAGSTASARLANTNKLHNSGVRLINGRGSVPSVDGVLGFTLATNDVAYVLGHFNCDGDPNTPTSVDNLAQLSTLPPGSSSGHNYETGELPASVVADAIVLLSQPSFTSYNTQANGWNDALSQYTYTNTNYSSTGWNNSNPTSSNVADGIYNSTGIAINQVPYDNSAGTVGSGNKTKLAPPALTEYSFAMLMGIVPTGKNNINQTSGGLNNFPRFCEGWSNSTTARIRGAFVALFECRVGTEPWNIRSYGAPDRKWGFNLLFNTGSMPPLTPKVISFRRSGANDITKAAYNVKLTDWHYPTLP